MKILMIDDTKPMPTFVTDTALTTTMRQKRVVARTYAEGVSFLATEKWDLLLLDHDLGVIGGKEKTGYDVMLWLERNKTCLPSKIECVSLNPAGRERIELKIKELYEKE